MVLILILAFAVRGLLSGFLNQIFGMLGLIAGLVTASWSAQWVATHWQGAQPAAVFWLLRWAIAVTAAFAVAALFQWLGSLLNDAFESTPLGWLSRPGGFVVGAGLGAGVASFVLLGLLLLPGPKGLVSSSAHARSAHPLMTGSRAACAAGARWVPACGWLERRFETAAVRAEHAGSAGSHIAS
jgi:membrane protein required for colicin V production